TEHRNTHTHPLIFLVLLTVRHVFCDSCNRVNYSNRRICAFKGSSVDISCTYNSYESSIQSTSWFRSGRGSEDLTEDSQYKDRAEVTERERGRSTLRIRDLTESDSAEYHFKFKTQDFEWKSSLPGTTLTVTGTDEYTIVEGSSVNLTCSSDANPAANYTWYKDKKPISTKQELIFRSIQSSDSGEYNCTAKNELGQRPSEVISINVKYAPKLASVSVSPSAEIVEGSSVTLTCSSDANPAANYTWYKENKLLLHGPVGRYHFSSISSEHSGNYSCKAENLYGPAQSVTLYIDVEYPPRLPSVSVSPSAEIVEGSSVTLTCSSDANPAASYTWYKEDEDSAKASGQNFTITDFRPEHIGSYYCVAQNTRGHHNSTLQLIVTASK
uniref:Ig-like domain-containing protein n=1 Tax=Haplochromis burtoni TaxID=8153 RepID=A0A3Q3C6A6_HAPBU